MAFFAMPLLFVRDVKKNIFHIAVQNFAQVVEGGGGNISILLEGVQSSLAEGISFDEGVGGHPFFLHGLPQGSV